MPSCPTIATSRPRKPAIQPLRGSPCPVSRPDITTPNMASQKNSYDWKPSAASASMGAKMAKASMPTSVPRNDPAVAMPIASPARPDRASGKPSSDVAALAGVPGMFSKMALRLPP